MVVAVAVAVYTFNTNTQLAEAGEFLTLRRELQDIDPGVLTRRA